MMAHPPDDAHGASLTPGNDPFGTPLDAARALSAEKLVIFPADSPDAGLHCTGAPQACREGTCAAATDPKARGKHPRVARWDLLTADDVPDDGQLVEWFGEGLANLAVSCGPSRLLIVDDDVDGGLIAYAEHMGVTVPDTFTVTTYQGHHYYFRQPAGRDPLGNRAGWLHDFGCDVRGAGGYVIGPGSLHWSGGRYTVTDDGAPVEAPEWLIEAIEQEGSGPPAADGGGADARGKAGEPGTALPTSGGARWDPSPRYGSPVALRAQYARHCREVRSQGAEYRWELFLAARDGWRLVNLGLLDVETMHADMRRCIARCWPADDPKVHRQDGRPAPTDDPRDWKIIDAEARVTGKDSAARSPWELASVAGGREFRSRLPDRVTPSPTSDDTAEPMAESRTTDGNRPVEDARDTDRVDSGVSMADESLTGDPLLDGEIEVQRRRRMAREWLDAEALPELRPKTWAEFRATPRPEYLVPRMLYRNGLSVVFGAPGSGKSFMVLDIALALATAREWQGRRLTGRDGGPGLVHYVMAEGVDINLLRADAWVRHHGVTDDEVEGHFVTIEEGIALTDPGITQYLPIVTHGRPDLIILDTKNALFIGNESAGDELGAMIRVLNRLRRAAGNCAIILVDHSGLKDDNRARGSNAQQAGVHTEVMVSLDEETGLYTALMKRDKAAGLSRARWHWRLQAVQGIETPEDMDTPAVCIPAEPEDYKPFHIDGAWFTDMRPLHDGVVAIKGHGKTMALVIVRILRWVNASNGLTLTDIKDAIQAAGQKYDRTQAHRALALLEESEIIGHPPKTTARWLLVPPYDQPGREG
jgi:hypothetical protein